MPETKIAYCGYPEGFILSDDKEKKLKHLFWGDTIEIRGEKKGKYLPVYSRDISGWMHETSLQDEPLLDMIFLDVGQGDSCIIVTPKDDKILLDAGQSDNLVRYLRWRYKNFSTKKMQRMVEGKIKTILLSHFDADHYAGLKKLVGTPEFSAFFKPDKIFHSGLFLKNKKTGKESAETLGPTTAYQGSEYFDDTILDKAALEAFFQGLGAEEWTGYSKLLSSIIKKSPSTDIQILSAGSPALNDSISPVALLTITVLSPVLTDVKSHKLLKKFDGEVGIQKNGHSVILKVQYGNITILLPGDVNEESEAFLIEHYKNKKDVFKSDVYKVAHHGSSNFSDEFVGLVKPFVYIISSGDNEQHSHPRPDTLGLLGKAARGDRPLIFCTELARSAKEYTETPAGLRKKLDTAFKEYAAAETDEKKASLKKIVARLEKELNRSISVYGAINLRTNGEKILFSQKKEQKKGNKEWDIYCLEPKNGNLVPVPLES